MITKRQAKLLNILKEQKRWIKGRELASFLNVSDRTIRADINKISQNFVNQIILTDKHKGYFLKDDTKKEIKYIEKNRIPQNSQERLVYLLHKLLFSDKPLDLHEIEDEIFISEYSLENDLKNIKNKISQYSNLTLSRSKNYIFLDGTESEKRSFYKKLLEEETSGNFLNMNALAELYTDFDLLQIKEIFEKTIKDHNYTIRNTSLPMLMMHIGICLVRLLQKQYVQTDIDVESIKKTLEYKISCDFFKRLKLILPIQLIENENVYLAFLLKTKKNNLIYKNNVIYKNSTYDIVKLVNDLLENILDIFNVDLRYDNELRIGLQLHILSLFERQKYDNFIKNLYLQEIKTKYPLIFEMAICATKIFYERTKMVISDDEIGFIAMHLGAAYERSYNIEKHRVIFVYPEDQTFTELCNNRILSRFSDRITVVKQLNTFEENKVIECEPDVIITTLPLKHFLNIPTVRISIFFNSEDEVNLFHTLNDIEKKKRKNEFECFIKDIIYKDLFYLDLKADSKEEVISKMCDSMYDKKMVSKDFKQSVLYRESLSPTSLVYGLATPHAFHQIEKQSCISIALLDKPLRWGSFDVSIVIILSIRDNDQKLMKIFFEWLSDIVSDTFEFSNLLKVKTFEQFMSFLEK